MIFGCQHDEVAHTLFVAGSGVVEVKGRSWWWEKKNEEYLVVGRRAVVADRGSGWIGFKL